jgi:hypothetical protein
VAARDNHLGTVGVAPGARIVDVKVLGDHGGGTNITAARGINHSVTLGVDVINLSLTGQTGHDPSVDAAVRNAVERGVVVVAAAGNDDRVAQRWPASLDGTIGVSAIADHDGRPGGRGGPGDDRHAAFTDHAGAVEVAAPGVGITTLANQGSGVANYGGTSAATPHVAGAAATWLLGHPDTPRSGLRSAGFRAALHGSFGVPQTSACGFRRSKPGSYEPLVHVGPCPGDGSGPATGPTPVPSVSFGDVQGGPHAAAIRTLATRGVTAGCTRDGRRFCPEDTVTRAQLASFLVRAAGLDPMPDGPTRFRDVSGGTHSGAIATLAAAGVVLGCGDGTNYCGSAPVTRAQMATFLSRAYALPAGRHRGFADTRSDRHEANIRRIASAGITLGCGADAYCPTDHVSRAQMASFLTRVPS